MKMDGKHFAIWKNGRETEIMFKDTGQRVNLTNEQFFELLRFLGPLVETAFPDARHGG